MEEQAPTEPSQVTAQNGIEYPGGTTLHIHLDEPGNYPEESVTNAIEQTVTVCQNQSATATLESEEKNIVWCFDRERRCFAEYLQTDDGSLEMPPQCYLTKQGLERRLSYFLWECESTNMGLYTVESQV
jgi:hypothetical protein